MTSWFSLFFIIKINFKIFSSLLKMLSEFYDFFENGNFYLLTVLDKKNGEK